MAHTFTQEDDLFLRKAEEYLQQENISPPRFPHLGGALKAHKSSSRLLEMTDEAPTGVSSQRQLSTQEDLKFIQQSEQPVTDDLTTMISSERRFPKSGSYRVLSTDVNLSPRSVQTQQREEGFTKKEQDFITASFKGEEKQQQQLGFTFSNKKLSLLKKGSSAQSRELSPAKRNKEQKLQNAGELENLVALEDSMKESVISEIIDERCRSGKYFTYAGPVLIAVNPRDPLLQKEIFAPFRLGEYNYESVAKNKHMRPHLYSVTLSAYSALLTEKKNQVITMIGEKGTGKSTLMRHALQHLVRVKPDASKDRVASRLQEVTAALDILSIMSQHTAIEDRGLFHYDSAAFVVKTLYDPQRDYEPVGCQISSKLLDCTLPKARGARTYDALHALFHTPSKRILTNLGIGHLNASHLKLFFGNCSASQEKVITYTEQSLRTYDSLRWKRLIECFDILEFSQDQVYNVLDVLAMVILIAEQKLSVRNNAPVSSWKSFNASIYKGAVFFKLQKLLGIPESKLLEIFQQKSEKGLVRQLRTFQRVLYSVLYEFLLHTVNTKLRERYIASLHLENEEEERDYESQFLEVAIINFPGFKHNTQGTLGGFVNNVSVEALNFYCSQQFMKMIDQLNAEGLSMKCLKTPLCQSFIDFMLANESGLVFKLERLNKQSLLAYLEAEEQKQLQSEQKQEDDGSLKQERLFYLGHDSDTLMLRFTFGNACYSLSKLKRNITDFNRFSKEIYQTLRYHSSHPLFKIMQKHLNSQLAAFSINQQPETRFSKPKPSAIFSFTLSEQLAPLLNRYLGCTPFIIYCFHSMNSIPSPQYSPFIVNYYSRGGLLSEVGETPRILLTPPRVQEDEDREIVRDKFTVDSVKGIPKAVVARTVRNTLIHPILIWECFGFPDWIELKEFSRDFSGLLTMTRREQKSDAMFFQLSNRERAYAILICFADPLHFMVGTDHVLLKPGMLRHLQSLVRQPKKAGAIRLQSFPGEPADYVSSLRRKISTDFHRLFSPINYSWNPFEYDLKIKAEHPLECIKASQIAEEERKLSKSFYKESFDTVSSKPSQAPNSSRRPALGTLPGTSHSSLNYISGALTPSRSKKGLSKSGSKGGLSSPYRWPCGCPSRTNLTIRQREQSQKSLHANASTSEMVLNSTEHSEIRKIMSQALHSPARTKRRVDYQYYLPDIIKIQAWVRGFLVRKRKKWLQFAQYCATTIQRHWKGYKQRKFYLFYQLRKYAAIAIQRKYRARHLKRVKAARIVQRFYLKHLEKKLLPLASESLDDELARYERLTKEVMGDVLMTEKVRRTALVNTLSPDSKSRHLKGMKLKGNFEEIKEEATQKGKKEKQPVYKFAPTINEKSRKMVQKKRKAMEYTGRKLEREMFRKTLQHSGSATERKGKVGQSKSVLSLLPLEGSGLQSPLTKTNLDFKNSTSTPPPAKRLETSFSSPFPPKELNPLGVTETGADILDYTGEEIMPGGDRLRERLGEQERAERAKKREKLLQRKAEHEKFLRRQEEMERKRKTRQMERKEREKSELQECTWSPEINAGSKKINRTYEDLSSWHKKKERELHSKRSDQKRESDARLQDFKASKNSEKILKKAEKRITHQLLESARSQKSIMEESVLTKKQRPIWPLKFEKPDTEFSSRRVFTQGNEEAHESFLVMGTHESEGYRLDTK